MMTFNAAESQLANPSSQKVVPPEKVRENLNRSRKFPEPVAKEGY
jgi:hypothetical protein